MNNVYDLHCHSTASDGTLSPSDVVKRAVAQGVNVLALTDHDTIAGLAEAKRQAIESGIELISGVEISTQWGTHNIHIVGLNFDINNHNLNDFLAEQTQLRDMRAREIGEKLQKIGIENAYNNARLLAGGGGVTRAHYARYLVQIGKVSNDSQAFKKYLGQGKVAYVKTEWSSIPTAIEIIHGAGGKAVLAHPLRYKMTNRWVKKLVSDFCAWGGDAIEVVGSGQMPNQREFLARLAQEFGLSASVGSDFHFPCGWVELGKGLYRPTVLPFVLED